MFEQERKVKKRKEADPAMPMPAKKLNIYKVVTTIAQSTDGIENCDRTDYVRAKTLAGAAKIVADKYVVATLATQEDLLALAKVAVIGERAV